MMSLCKSLHHLLGFPNQDDRCRRIPSRRCGTPPPYDSPGLRCVAGLLPTSPAYVVESAAVGPKTAPSTPSTCSSSPPSPQLGEQHQQQQQQQPPADRIDEVTCGLSYLDGRRGSSLELCTESLGFESCCDGRMGAEEQQAEREIRRRIEEAERASCGGHGPTRRRKVTPARGRAEAKEFPPPLQWLGTAGGGGSFSFLKAVREDGRFLLTEVRIERPEILRASRRDGRLRLELVKPEPEPEPVVLEEEISAEEEAMAGEKVLEVETGGEAKAEETLSVTVAEGTTEDEERQRRWQLPGTALDRRREGGTGFRSGRCQEALREGLSSSPVWVNRFVTTA